MLGICRFLRVLNETFLVHVLTYGNETIIWNEKERSRIRAIQMDNLRGFLGIRRMDSFPNAKIRELCRVKKGIDERIDEGVLQLFGQESLFRRMSW